MKVPLQNIYDDLNFASDRLSTQIRALTLGILALVWLFLSGSKDVPVLKIGTRNPLLAIAFLCIITLLIDAAQYWSLYISANAVRKQAELSKHSEAEYDERGLIRRLQQICFWAKQITVSLAAAWLLTLIAVTVGQ